MSRISVPKGAANFRGRKSNSLMNLCGKHNGTRGVVSSPPSDFGGLRNSLPFFGGPVRPILIVCCPVLCIIS